MSAADATRCGGSDAIDIAHQPMYRPATSRHNLPCDHNLHRLKLVLRSRPAANSALAAAPKGAVAPGRTLSAGN